MAAPRVFVSSTCYDLKEIRYQLRNFITDFGFDPVMSEFGDIFYNYDQHVQDACLDEINKCQLFVLIIGNNYGSIYHNNTDPNSLPDSVTLKEFKKALETNIYKHIFINRFVNYDYQNYVRNLEKEIFNYLSRNDVADSKIDEVRQKIKMDFDNRYYFNHESYKYIFFFLEIIHGLKKNNAISPFESFDEIKNDLRRQWAGFMYDSITQRSTIKIDEVHYVTKKIEGLEDKLNKLLKTKSINKGTRITFDIETLLKDINLENLEELQKKTTEIMSTILYDLRNNKRIVFNEKFDSNKVEKWLGNLKNIIISYKWSQYIDIHTIFKNIAPYKYWKGKEDVPSKALIELYSIYDSFEKNDQESFRNTLMLELNKCYEEPKEEDDVPQDDVPF